MPDWPTLAPVTVWALHWNLNASPLFNDRDVLVVMDEPLQYQDTVGEIRSVTTGALDDHNS